MCVAVIGGMTRLKRDYEERAAVYGVDLKIFTVWTTGMTDRLKNVDAILVFTGKTSHNIRDAAVRIAKARDIPILMTHSCGISSLRSCLGNLVLGQRGGTKRMSP